MIALARHLRAQLFLVLVFGALVALILSAFVETGRTATVVGWCLAVFWTLALFVEAARRLCLWKFPEARLSRRMHILLLVVSGFLLMNGTGRLLALVLQFRAGSVWLEYAILRMVTDSYGGILFMVVCMALGMAAAAVGVMLLGDTLRTARDEGGVGRDVAATVVILNVVAMIAAPIQDWNNYDTFLERYIDSWYMDVYIDSGPIQLAMYALTGCFGAFLTSRWLRSATRGSAIRTLFLVVLLWSLPFVYNILFHSVDSMLLYDRGDLFAWTTMMIPAALFLVATFPAFAPWVARLWKGDA